MVVILVDKMLVDEVDLLSKSVEMVFFDVFGVFDGEDMVFCVFVVIFLDVGEGLLLDIFEIIIMVFCLFVGVGVFDV